MPRTPHDNNNSDPESQSFLSKPEHNDRPDEVEDRAVSPLSLGAPTLDNRPQRRSRALHWLRIVVEVIVTGALLACLLGGNGSSSEAERGRVEKSPVPIFPRKIVTFHNDPKYAAEDMFFNESATLHVLHNWIEFTSASRGYIRHSPTWPASQTSSLPSPHTISYDRSSSGPGYMMSVFHQLHCLSYIAEHFQQGYGGIELDEEVAHHAAHCFNYVRQGIICAGDVTLEGETGEGPGEGSRHECVDYGKLKEWANEHAGEHWREGLLPGESIL